MNEKQKEVPSIMEELIGDSDTDGYDRNYWQIRSLQYWMSQLSQYVDSLEERLKEQEH